MKVFDGKPSVFHWNGVLRDHIIGGIDDDGVFRLQVDDYNPLGIDEFDGELWEEQSAHIKTHPTKDNWKAVYRIARILQKGGHVKIYDGGRVIDRVECDGSILSINMNGEGEISQ